MIDTMTQAEDEMQALFRAAWLADPDGAQAPIVYWDVSQKPPKTGAWCRITIRHLTGGQVAVGGPEGSRRYTHHGLVSVQVFTPMGGGRVLSDTLTMVARHAFEGKATSPGRVIFRNVRVNEVGRDGKWFQVNVLADFEYDQVR